MHHLKQIRNLFRVGHGVGPPRVVYWTLILRLSCVDGTEIKHTLGLRLPRSLPRLGTLTHRATRWHVSCLITLYYAYTIASSIEHRASSIEHPAIPSLVQLVRIRRNIDGMLIEELRYRGEEDICLIAEYQVIDNDGRGVGGGDAHSLTHQPTLLSR